MTREDIALKFQPCPFCGNDMVDPIFTFMEGGFKFGAVQCPDCGGCGPDVHTQYDEGTDPPWHKEAIEFWNERKVRT